MKNKKLDELKKERPTTEEQIAFVDELTKKSQKRQKELRIWIENLKIELGIRDEIR